MFYSDKSWRWAVSYPLWLEIMSATSILVLFCSCFDSAPSFVDIDSLNFVDIDSLNFVDIDSTNFLFGQLRFSCLRRTCAFKCICLSAKFAVLALCLPMVLFLMTGPIPPVLVELQASRHATLETSFLCRSTCTANHVICGAVRWYIGIWQQEKNWVKQCSLEHVELLRVKASKSN